MSSTFRTLHLYRAMSTFNAWIVRKNRPLTWHKLQLVFNKLALDIERGQDVNIQNLGAGTVTLAADAPVHQFLDAGGGAAILNMPAEVQVPGVRWAIRIANTSAGATNISVNMADGATLIGAVAQNESRWVIWDGASWAFSIA